MIPALQGYRLGRIRTRTTACSVAHVLPTKGHLRIFDASLCCTVAFQGMVWEAVQPGADGITLCEACLTEVEKENAP